MTDLWVVNAGKVELKGGGLGVMLIPITQSELDNGASALVEKASGTFGPFELSEEERLIFGGKAQRYFNVVGAVYTVERTDQTSILANTASFKGMWPNETERISIQSFARLRDMEREGKKKLEKLKEDGDMLATLAPLRNAYRKAVGQNRAHLLAAFVEYITR